MFLRATKRTKDGRIGNLWLMDRGVPTEKTLAEMRRDGYRYLVGAPRGHLKILGKKFDDVPWERVQDGISVKVAKTAVDGAEDTFVLTSSSRYSRRRMPAES